jgi:hypothetical protein
LFNRDARALCDNIFLSVLPPLNTALNVLHDAAAQANALPATNPVSAAAVMPNQVDQGLCPLNGNLISPPAVTHVEPTNSSVSPVKNSVVIGSEASGIASTPAHTDSSEIEQHNPLVTHVQPTNNSVSPVEESVVVSSEASGIASTPAHTSSEIGQHNPSVIQTMTDPTPSNALPIVNTDMSDASNALLRTDPTPSNALPIVDTDMSDASNALLRTDPTPSTPSLSSTRICLMPRTPYSGLIPPL